MATVLVALDLLAAFNTLENSTQLKRLKVSFGITGTPQLWLHHYLTNRSPLLFTTMYRRLQTSLEVNHHQYSDETQLYISNSKNNINVNIATFEKCMLAVHNWFINGLA